ncbi:hypothetical protein SLEP1_g11118 [Rubroshorea leprosula]|uniref:Uncharacterized protein n=1 Tax=Rubroshorea leprosula TaxID=152421 RepID=A0AAV5IES7_9ROSI|nr:hypothetical protein SLEP1_g11118 [Rubroshorea leprosula]
MEYCLRKCNHWPVELSMILGRECRNSGGGDPESNKVGRTFVALF